MSKPKTIFLAYICFLLVVFFIIKNQTLNVIHNAGSAYSGKVITKPVDLYTDNTTTTLNNIIKSYPGIDVGLSVIDISTGQSINAGTSDRFIAASTTKLLSSVAYMQLVENGDATLDKNIGGFAATTLLRRMLNQSDNSAWANIDGFITYKGLENYAHEIGISTYDRRYNTISSPEAVDFLQKLYKGQLIYTKNRDILFSFMQNTENEDLIPPALPSGSVFYHKAGYIYGNLHDIAIIEYKKHTVALAIYTNNLAGSLADYDSRLGLIHKLTRTVIAP